MNLRNRQTHNTCTRLFCVYLLVQCTGSKPWFACLPILSAVFLKSHVFCLTLIPNDMVLLSKDISSFLFKLCRYSSLSSNLVLSCGAFFSKNIVSVAAEKPPMILERASKLVDTDVSHFDIRNLMRKEHDLSTFAMDKVSKMQDDLVSVKHPIIEVANEIFNDEERTRSSLGGFCLLLLAKSLQSVPSYTPSDETWKKQKIFAECYEMIDKAMYLHHHAIIDTKLEYDNNTALNAQNNGNKLAILFGDYLFSYAIIRLASLVRQANVFEFIGVSIDEFCINHFDERTAQEAKKNRSSQSSSSGYCSPLSQTILNFKTSADRNDYPWSRIDRCYWEKFGGYCSTDLFAYSSQYISIMTDLRSRRNDEAAFKFGYNLRLLWNLKDDITSIKYGAPKFNLISLPIIEYLKVNPKFKKTLSTVDVCDPKSLEKIRKTLLNSDSLDRCQNLLFEYSEECLKALKFFPNCSSREVLESICLEV